jgi:undecaprenyl-diphosphatase
VIIYLRDDIAKLTVAWFSHGLSREQTPESKLGWWIIISTIPGVIFGFLMKDFVAENLRIAMVVAITTIVFGLLLWYADITAKQTKTIEKIGLKEAVIIGLAQAIAIIPGTSRSGITMTAGLMLGLDRESTAKFSFLLSIPIILGAGLFSVLELLGNVAKVNWNELLYGAVFSFVAAYLCIFLFLNWISRIGMLPFVIYRLVLGFVLLYIVLG